MYKDSLNRSHLQISKGLIDFAKGITNQNSATKAVEQVLEDLASGKLKYADEKGIEMLEVNKHTRDKACKLAGRNDWRNAVYTLIYDRMDEIEKRNKIR